MKDTVLEDILEVLLLKKMARENKLSLKKYVGAKLSTKFCSKKLQIECIIETFSPYHHLQEEFESFCKKNIISDILPA